VNVDEGPLREQRPEEVELLSVFRSKKKLSAAIVGVGVIGTLVTVALGSPGSGFVGQTPLVTANFDKKVHVNNDRVKFQTKRPTDVRVQQFDIAPGGFSGWHHHPGIVILAVQSGLVTLTHSDCSSKTYGPTSENGAVFVEDDEPVQVSSAGGATVYATFVAPSADPPVFRIEDSVQACP
jgi:hypothetical protein